MGALPLESQQALEIAISTANRDWTNHARPIALAAIAMDAPVGLYTALTDNHNGKDWLSRAKTEDYRRAVKMFDDARTKLLAMMGGIRDNYRCDHFRSYPADMSSISEDEADEIEAYNDALDAGIMSVDAFMTEVERG